MGSGERRELTGVFRDREQAESVAEKAKAAGVPEEDIHIDRREDRAASLRGEMRDELERSWASPQGAFIVTKRAMKGALVASPVAVVVGILLVLPFAFLSWGFMPLWGRIIATSLIGATAGATVGFIVGAGEAEKGASAPMAAEQGVTVNVGDARPEVQQMLVDEEPLRLDVTTPDGAPLGTVTSESERNDEGVMEDFGRALHEPDRDLHDRHDDLSSRQDGRGGGTAS